MAGYLFGSRTPCTCGCELCETGEAPETLTVTFSGFPDIQQSEPLISLSLTSCYGSGAAGTVSAPGGERGVDEGPIASTSVSSPGYGYAIVARVTPSGSVEVDDDAVFSPTWTEDANGCGIPYWRISSVAVTPGGSGYYDNQLLTIIPGVDVSYSFDAELYVRTVRTAPTVEADLSYASGTAGALSVTLAAGTDFEGRDIWSVSGLLIDTAGTGYAEWDTIYFSVTDGQEVYGGSATITSVGGSGEITGVSIDYGGEYFKDTGEPETVTVAGGGEYWIDSPSDPAYVADITVDITQDADGIGTGADLSAVVDDDPASPTFGQVTGFTIDSAGTGYLAWEWEPLHCCGSQLNGRAIVLRRSAEDKCYYDHILCGGWNDTYVSFFVGRPRLVDARLVPWVRYRGPALPPLAGIMTYQDYTSDGAYGESCSLSQIEGDDLVTDCGDISFTATGDDGIAATVEPGGTYDEEERTQPLCHSLCHDGGEIPDEITISITAIAPGAASLEGDYVCPLAYNVASPAVKAWGYYTSSYLLYIAIYPAYGGDWEEEGNCPRMPRLQPSSNIYDTSPGEYLSEYSPCRPHVGYTWTLYHFGIPWATAEVVA